MKPTATTAAVAVALASAIPQPACSDASAVVATYQRGAESIALCANGGYSARLATGVLEGRYSDDERGITTTTGTTGARRFTLSATGADTWSSAELGDDWRIASLDADQDCLDLEARAWWFAAEVLPKATAFAKPPDLFATVEACHDAQVSGDWPANATCEDHILFCPDGRLELGSGDIGASGTYTAIAGQISVVPDDGQWFSAFEGTFVEGTLTAGSIAATGDTFVWREVPASVLEPEQRCR